MKVLTSYTNHQEEGLKKPGLLRKTRKPTFVVKQKIQMILCLVLLKLVKSDNFGSRHWFYGASEKGERRKSRLNRQTEREETRRGRSTRDSDTFPRWPIRGFTRYVRNTYSYWSKQYKIIILLVALLEEVDVG